MDVYKKGLSAYKATQKGASDGKQNKPTPGLGPPSKATPPPTVTRSPSIEGFVKSTHTESGYRKAAKFLLLVGKEEALKVLKHFSEEEIEGITREIADIRNIPQDEAAKILSDFGFIKQAGPILRGGPDTARAMLKEAFGEERAEALIKKVGPFKGSLKPFAFLHDLDFAQIMLLLKNEPDTVLSVILPHLDPALASKILKTLPLKAQKATVKRIAVMSKIDSAVLSRIEETLKEKVRKQGKVVTNEIDGKKALADILKHMDFLEEDSILTSLAEDSPELSKDIRDKLFTMDIIFYVGDKDMQKVLREYDETQIAMLLKDKTDIIVTHLLRNVSERRKAIILDEYEHLGKVKKKDAQTAAKEFLARLTTLAEEGTIVIKREREIYV